MRARPITVLFFFGVAVLGLPMTTDDEAFVGVVGVFAAVLSSSSNAFFASSVGAS